MAYLQGDPRNSIQHCLNIPTRLDHSTRWADDKVFEGEWTVIPTEDFTALYQALHAAPSVHWNPKGLAYRFLQITLVVLGVLLGTGLGLAICASRAFL